LSASETYVDQEEKNLTVLRDRIRDGAAWLDRHKDNWRDRVTVNDLDLGSVCRCVLGQVFTPEVQAELDSDYPDRYILATNDFDWVQERDRSDGRLNGFSYAVRERFDMSPEELAAVEELDGREFVIGDTTFITGEYARELAFDAPDEDEVYYTYHELTTEWKSYLNGEWE
jgi:hypothetical protein